jgi:hypothetical protein
MCYIDGQKNKYSVLNECNRMLKYNIGLLKFEIILISYRLFVFRFISVLLLAFVA